MTHFEERVERDLKELRDRVGSLATQVSTALENALRALLGGNRELAYATVLGDLPINRAFREIDKLCHRFIALHLPSGGHLRLISSIIRANIELERIGDYAVTISRHSVQRSEPPSGSIARELALMGEEARSVLRQATQAFLEGNAETAKAIMPAADREHEIFGIAFQDLVEREPDHNLRDLFGLFGVLNMLERVADQAKNICEETVFAVTGETKAAKVYRVVFLDEDNSCMSQMAEAIAAQELPGERDLPQRGTRRGGRPVRGPGGVPGRPRDRRRGRAAQAARAGTDRARGPACDRCASRIDRLAHRANAVQTRRSWTGTSANRRPEPTPTRIASVSKPCTATWRSTFAA